MSQPTNGEGRSGEHSGGYQQGGSLGQGWEQDEQSDTPYDAQNTGWDATQAVPAAPQEDGAHGASPAQGSEAADVAGSADSGPSSAGEQGYAAGDQQGYSQPSGQEPTGYAQSGSYGQQGQPDSGYGQQGQSDSGYGQQGGYGQSSYGQQAPSDAQAQQGWGQQDQQGAYGQQSPAYGASQPGQAGQQGQTDQSGSKGRGWGRQSGQPRDPNSPQAQVSQVVGGAGDGVGALFSDLQFKKSLTERIASLIFLVTIVWAVLHFLANTIYNFSSESVGNGISVKHMGTGNALIHLLTDFVALVLTVGVTRLLLELAVHVSRIAGRTKD
ncbi:DUF4282 domain-containing protein [Allobranchiibius sp. GilTou38]|uniref:DUF4282 domain-containing protein n=1 Tax=Allobranchiibius sp. GilTou38 TaxID=2815210 RepID=UPI001AA117E6|nr:DUF4282 domain-containing protein [Allobranchiibius sp. GilTou38]MBO1765459.1 DUF4282 domain-containing protein [Allobranchiibius sp. GilTou38]